MVSWEQRQTATAITTTTTLTITMEEERDYTIAACESLMIDYCQYCITSSIIIHEKQEHTATEPSSMKINDLDTIPSTGTSASALLRFFHAFHKISDQLYTEKQRLLNLPLPLMVAATLADLAITTTTNTTRMILTSVSNETTTASDGVNYNKEIDERSNENHVSLNLMQQQQQQQQQQQRNALFQRLQKIWMEKQHELLQPPPSLSLSLPLPLTRRRLPKHREQTRYYEWSPTLLIMLMQSSPPPVSPSNPIDNTFLCHDDVPEHIQYATSHSIVEALHTHLNQRRKELLHQAVHAQQQLLLMDASIDTKQSKATKKLKRSNTHQINELPLHRLDVADTDSDDDSMDDNDDTDATNTDDTVPKNNLLVPNIDNNNIIDIPMFPSTTDKMNADWKQVQIRRKVPLDDGIIDDQNMSPSRSEKSMHVLQQHSANHCVPVTVTHMFDETKHCIGVPTDSCCENRIECIVCDQSTAIPADYRNERDGRLPNSTNVRVLPIDNTDNPVTDDDVENAVDDNLEQKQQLQVPFLVEMIKDLKQQLLQMDKERIEEQQLAKKAIQHERDVAFERIQALQLRLYISETRLQTYEEALQYHIESVHRNVATPPVLIKESYNANALRNVHLQPPTDSSSVGSPLYARRSGETSIVASPTNKEV
jgi:hypothetical protein